MEGPETLDDRRSTPQSKRGSAGIVVVFCAGSPAFQWGALQGGRLRVGRGPDLGLLLDGRLSREHAEIAFDGERWTVTDLGSRNGTFVDGRQIKGEVAFDAAPRMIRMGHTIALPVTDGWQAVTAKPMREGELILGPRLRAALGDVERAARAGHNLLITGESGSGKELASRTYHGASPHSSGPLVAVNCATIPEGLAERLLFGAKKGAYSGAVTDVEGYVQSAHGGVLFLDELGELDAVVQAKLLRVLETQEVTPLGGTKSQHVDVRFCFATHRHLRERVASGRFRADLFYRIGQPEVALPPLRERLEEIPWLVCDAAKKVDAGLAVSAELVEACMLRAWPGNVRELLGEVKRAALTVAASKSRTLRPENLSPKAGTTIEASSTSLPPSAPASGQSTLPPAPPEPVREERVAITRERIESAFRELTHATAVARALGIHRSHLYRLMKQHGIARGDGGSEGGDDP
ncbi:MAG: sigma 54-interacting transcriptional regulator [Polyangiaceae bacterium]